MDFKLFISVCVYINLLQVIFNVLLCEPNTEILCRSKMSRLLFCDLLTYLRPKDLISHHDMVEIKLHRASCLLNGIQSQVLIKDLIPVWNLKILIAAINLYALLLLFVCSNTFSVCGEGLTNLAYSELFCYK